jgi:cyclophilin family peptidyl-prolyl cis-trans isomerase/HEAT repeat protein
MVRWRKVRWAALALVLAALAPRVAQAAAPRAAAPPAPTAGLLRAIAVAEDRREWADGVLAGALRHADPGVRARAALATGRLQDSLAVPALAPLAADPVAGVRREAVFALGQVGHRSARPALERALRDRDPEVVALAIEALGKLGDGSVTSALAPFLRAGTPAQRMRACESLWRLADTTGLDPLLGALGERDPAVRWRVVYALEKIPSPGRVVPAVVPALRDPDALVRAHAARTLGRERSPLATAALVAALDDADPAVVVNVIRALQQVADTSHGASRRILKLLAHRDPHVRVTAASALADSFAWVGTAADTAAVRAALRHGMQDSDFATRGACGRAFIVRERLRGLEAARGLFADSVAYVRAALLDGLRAMRAEDLGGTPPRVVNAISGQFHTAGDLLVRMTAAEVAGALIGRTRHAAFQPLLGALREGVDSREMLLAAACAGALGDAGDTVSVPRLAAAYAAREHDADADARIAIRDALRALAGRSFADSVERAHPQPAPPVTPDSAFFAAPGARRAVLHTSAGTMEWEFLSREAPQTVRNFVTLARRGYFDSLWVHRVVPDFVIQDGDPTGTGSGGPGHTIRCEYNQHRYEAGMVGMALSGKDTGGSQWFVTLSPQPHLNGRYTIFARVTRGLDVARKVTQGARVFRVSVLP